MLNNLKTLLLFYALFLPLLSLLPTSAAERVSIRPSSALRIIFQQLDKTYLTPMGKNFQETIKQEPDVFEKIKGSGLHSSHSAENLSRMKT
jgi:hypothetical protein